MAFEKGVSQAVHFVFFDAQTGAPADPTNPVVKLFCDTTDPVTLDAGRLTVKAGHALGIITLTAEEADCDVGTFIITSDNCRPEKQSFFTDPNYTEALAQAMEDVASTQVPAVAAALTSVSVNLRRGQASVSTRSA